MNRCFLILLFSTLFYISKGQNCLPSGITFTSQAEIDAFPSNYPNCTEIDGEVRIGYFQTCFNGSGPSTDISNLDSLNQINTIHGILIISNNPNLIDLTGLEGLNTIDNNLMIFCNDNLLSLNGLNNLITVGGITRIGNGSAGFEGNAKLQNLIGLSNLINPTLFIENNFSFKNFTGLNSANSLQSLSVTNCDSLENFTGLENISSINSNFNLVRNDSNFDFVGLGNLNSISGNFFLDRNDNQSFTGLTSLDQIQGSLEIFEGESLTSLGGLESLTTLESFTLVFTNSLTSLDGLDNWSNLSSPSDNFNNYIDLFNNASLNDISAISSIDTTGMDDIQIVLNSMLSECAIELVCDFLDANPANTSISTNMAGCNSNAEVETACSTLPVYYSEELKAHRQNKSILLIFSVSQQINNSHFEIQHSKGGRRFNKIGKIEGEGTSTKEISHEYLHHSPMMGLNYYRIKQVDFDGSFDYSNIVSIHIESETIQVSPNPAIDQITILSKNDNNTFVIYNSRGEVILRGLSHEYSKSIDVSHLEKGIYIIRINNLTIQQFVKM